MMVWIQRTEPVYLGGFEGVVWGKMNGDQEHSSCIRTIWRAHDGSLPMEHVLCHRSCYNPMKRSEYHLAFAVRRHYMAGAQDTCKTGHCRCIETEMSIQWRSPWRKRCRILYQGTPSHRHSDHLTLTPETDQPFRLQHPAHVPQPYKSSKTSRESKQYWKTTTTAVITDNNTTRLPCICTWSKEKKSSLKREDLNDKNSILLHSILPGDTTATQQQFNPRS
jgi:hypothetical protein